MKEDDFNENEAFEEIYTEEYCDDPYDNSDLENEEEYIRMLAENGEGLLMEEDAIINDEIIDEFTDNI